MLNFLYNHANNNASATTQPICEDIKHGLINASVSTLGHPQHHPAGRRAVQRQLFLYDGGLQVVVHFSEWFIHLDVDLGLAGRKSHPFF